MKKFLLSAALTGFAAIAMNAQVLSFQNNGMTLEDGAVVEFTNPDDWVYAGEIVDGYASGTIGVMVTVEPHLTITANEPATISLQATSLLGNDIQLCAFDGYCLPGVDPIKANQNLAENTPVNLQLEAVLKFKDGEKISVPYYEILVEAWETYDKESTLITMLVKMGDPANAAVESLVANENLVKVAGKVLSYDVTGTSSLNVYSLSGKSLINTQVAGSGSISLASLPKGVYVYRVAGKTVKSGKFIIR